MGERRDDDHRTDPFDLGRFLREQESVYDKALRELRSGRKRTHWMWYIFPQISGLGLSTTSMRYAIKSVDEARHYLSHPVLGPRLVECAEAVLGVEGRSASEIFGYPDDLKLKSCMTLFEQVVPQASVFSRVIDTFYAGQRDEKTLQLLEKMKRE